MVNVWAVCADYGKYARNFVDGGYAAVGWIANTDLTGVTTREEIWKLYAESQPHESPNQVGANASQVAYFLLDIQPGDYVITPSVKQRKDPFYFGRIEEAGSYYAPEADDGCRFQHRRRVKWNDQPVSISMFSDSFQRTLIRTSKTVFRFRQNEEFLARIASEDFRPFLSDKFRACFDFERVRPFLEKNHRGVITTRQADGAAHASIVVCGAYQGNAAFVTVYGNSAKVRNLRRDPACTVLAVTDDWRAFVSVEGQASLFDASNTEPEKLRVLLREVYRACGDKDHPDWDEYDQAMVDQRAVVVLVRPERVYGLLR